MVTSTVSIPELIWTIGTLVGLFFNSRQLRRAVGDYVIVKRKKINSIREYAAVTTMFMFASWTFVQFMMVLVGIMAMFAKNVIPFSPLQFTLVVTFLAISMLLAITGYVVDARRSVLVKKLAEIEEEGW